jgi:hypothetical protein
MKTSLIKTGLYCVLIIAGFYAHISCMRAQVIPTPPCWSHHSTLVFPLQHATSSLPLNTGMPLDVMVGYIAYDSLARSLSAPGINNIYNNLIYSDTLRYAMKYCYKMLDYNPLLFEQFRRYNDSQRRYASARTNVFQQLLNKIVEVSPAPFVETLLCQSSIIAHINVVDTFRVVDGSGGGSSILTIHTVTATVTDTIKGQVFPHCINFLPLNINKEDHSDTFQSNILPANCLQFTYALEWPRIPFNNKVITTEQRMVDPAGSPWVKTGKEYIVFLNFSQACSDENYSYHILSAFGTRSSANNIYPISNGRVEDPNNDFGLGTAPTVSDFKSALQQKIHQITHFGE